MQKKKVVIVYKLHLVIKIKKTMIFSPLDNMKKHVSLCQLVKHGVFAVAVILHIKKQQKACEQFDKSIKMLILQQHIDIDLIQNNK